MVLSRNVWGIVGLIVVGLLVVGCGKEEPEQGTSGSQQTTDSPGGMPTFGQSAEQTREALTQMNDGVAVEALPPAAIKGYLPGEMAGFMQTDATAERTEMGGMDVAVADAQYEAADGEGYLEVTITDVGNLTGPMKMGMTGWTMGQYSRETDSGYEKTTTYDGFKAMEEYDNENQSGALRVFVADRFVVEVSGGQVTMETIKQAMGKVELKKLAAAK